MFMKTFVLTVCTLLLGAVTVWAVPKKTPATWVDEAVKAKMGMLTDLEKSNMPVVSAWMKKKMKAEPFTVNLTGLDRLVLMTDGGKDGSSYDHAVWANARLIKKDGTSVWLDALKYETGWAGWNVPLMNRNSQGKGISIAGKKYDHGVFCHANGLLVYALNGEYVRFEAEVGIDDASNAGSAYFKALHDLPSNYIAGLQKNYPDDCSVLLSILGELDAWLVTKDTSVEEQHIKKLLNELKSKSYYTDKLKKVAAEPVLDARMKSMLLLLREVAQVADLQKSLEWLNLPAIKLAYDDMKRSAKFNVAKYEPMLNELSALVGNGFSGIYEGNLQSISDANRALELKKAILLGNPLLDADKIVASRYKLGMNARKAMAPDLGTQSNNWSNQESARRGGFNADIVELSNLRGDIQLRQIYKPNNGSSIADLRMHWDGDRMMFTQLQEDKRWNIFEVKLDGTGLHKLVENEEPDLEFYDGTYLPDGRILAISNIGYQGVPCVSGSDQVGNLVLYNPKDKNLRRLTFDQDANWNPVIMNNGKVMYTRWEYTDLTHYYSRIVMHMNPDGTENKALYGSGAMFPNSTFDVQPLPNRGSAFVGIISGHHGVARSGRMIVFDPAKGRKSVAGMVQEIPYRNRPIKELIKDQLVDGVWPQFIKPTVLNDKYFLVAAKLSPTSLWGIYLVDVFDNVTCIMEMEGEGFISPILVQKVPTPPVIPDRVKLD